MRRSVNHERSQKSAPRLPRSPQIQIVAHVRGRKLTGSAAGVTLDSSNGDAALGPLLFLDIDVVLLERESPARLSFTSSSLGGDPGTSSVIVSDCQIQSHFSPGHVQGQGVLRLVVLAALSADAASAACLFPPIISSPVGSLEVKAMY